MTLFRRVADRPLLARLLTDKNNASALHPLLPLTVAPPTAAMRDCGHCASAGQLALTASGLNELAINTGHSSLRTN
jgi:hypothetical protein